MPGEKATGSCNKFQPNIFNKSKCQNCFKSREVHLLKDSDLEQAKPVYAGWLCLAPVGTDFDNPMQRSRKWQRRFFILYERGSLTYALDELPSTLPQGTVNMNLCTNVTDAEPRTGQRNALCIVTPAQEIFIRGENKEIINGWCEQLTLYLRTNKQNQKKKRKVDPVTNQDPSPAKMAATGQSCPASEAGSAADSHHWQEELHAAGLDVTPVWTVTNTDPPGPEWNPEGNTSSHLCPTSRGSLTSNGAGRLFSSVSSPDLTAAGHYNQLTESSDGQTSASRHNQRQDRRLGRSAEQLLGSESTRRALRGGAAASRQGRPNARPTGREKLLSTGDGSLLNVPPPQRRAKSLDRRTSDTAMTPDLLNFKKGWMMKLDDDDDEWKKYWFVLSTASLRYYKDSVAEESSDLVGEIDLTKCYSVSEYEVQRNYGFQIHTQKATYTLSAMTAGIRRNWIQALMKNVHPANAPDVANLPGHHIAHSPPEIISKPDVTQDSGSTVPAIKDHPSKPKTVMERWHEGHSKTFDWSELNSENQLTVDVDRLGNRARCFLELGDLERRRRREERRRRYESLLGFSLGRAETWKTEDGTVQALSPKSQQRTAEKIAECWRQVEKATLRPERKVVLSAEVRDTLEVEKLLQGCRKVVDDLKAQLADSERRRLQLEAQLSAELSFCPEQQDLPSLSEAAFHPADVHLKPVTDLHDSDGLHWSESGLASGIWMHDTDGDSAERDGLLLVATASDGQYEVSQVDGRVVEPSCESQHQKWRDREGFQLFHASETDLLVQERPEGRDGIPENHLATEQSSLKRLSQEVELLTSQNQALNQRNQEMLNQLTEADREIERLKVELGNRYTEPRHLLEVEQQETMKLEDLEGQLSLRNQELLEAQMLITSLEENLKETEVLLQLRNSAETDGSGEDESNKSPEKAEQLQCLDTTEAKLKELQRQLEQSEVACRQLEHQNTKLKEKGEMYLRKAAMAEADIRRLTEEKREEADGNWSVPGEEKFQQVMEGAATRLEVLRKLLDLMDNLDFPEETEEEEESAAVVGQLRWEETFWKSLLNEMKKDLSQQRDPSGELLCEVMEGLILEKQMVLAGHELLLHEEMRRCESKALKDVDFRWEPESSLASETRGEEDNCRFGINDQLKNLKAVTQTKISSLNLLASSVSSSALDGLLPAAERLSGFYFSHHPASASFIRSAATEAFCCCLLSRRQAKYDRRVCSNCVGLQQEDEALKTRLSALEEPSTPDGAKMSRGCQTNERSHQFTDTELQRSGGGDAEETLDMQLSEKDIPPTRLQKISDKGLEESDEKDSDLVTQQISSLQTKVEELKEQLRVSGDELKEDFDQKMRCVQEQHEREIAKLKATCEHGLVAMEDCHLRVVEELQRLQQQEVERLLLERERLLEEESAATATAIEAIKNAHREELQKEIQRRRQSESSNGDAQLEDILKEHREELASFQRELDVLSQQFSLKCLENGHLVQALDAERKALCQCQQENQDLRSRNQELSGHLAAEITRLCSLAKQDQLPLGQKMDLYEMEITLRVKQSEVQCLKQEVASLKDDLQTAVKDKRNAAKKYKDVHTELSIIRAKAEQEADELRENLRLAHQALGETSP
ncbi:myosin phosphatase Rho-interacting protein-like isoform X1 [Girardinichthys multiradiatus]|uniref:myosin phosphatase Rho-interacting protein-like isoform X1 n=1 Tax=Girardinichthys multiradiatus TaxID=208333 RepID=UPI001FAE4986|nr:myosin phosphatase Rho-interacting protein-like isoform X1 [Girardinichthys multiradiatus]